MSASVEFWISVLQLSLERNMENNLRKTLNLSRLVPKGGILLLPEMFIWNFEEEEIERLSSMTPQVLDALGDLSRKRDLIICGTLPEKTEEGIRNTAYLIDRGYLIGKRSKIKLFPLFGEDKHFIPGEENPVFNTRFGRIGILICFELRFTDLVMDLKKKEAELILVPAQWGLDRKPHLETLAKARAVELQSFLAVSNIWGTLKETEFAGSSGIYSPWGEILGFSDKGDAIITSRIRLGDVEDVRRRIPVNIG